jgi:hypothetical protein
VGRAQVTDVTDGVTRVEIELLRRSSGWQIRFDNPDPATVRRFTWVVADNTAETGQPWVDAPTELTLTAELTGQSVTGTVRVANRGTAPLEISDPTGLSLAPPITLTAVPNAIGPGACGTLEITFAGLQVPGTQTAAYAITTNDAFGTGVAGHNHQVNVTVTVRQKALWNSGDILVLDPLAAWEPVGARGADQGGSTQRSPDDGQLGRALRLAGGDGGGSRRRRRGGRPRGLRRQHHRARRPDPGRQGHREAHRPVLDRPGQPVPGGGGAGR